MPTTFDRDKIRKHLENFDLCSLFIEELGWDHGGTTIEAAIADRTFVLEAIAQKRGMVIYQYVADSDDAFPDHPTRQKIEKTVAKTVREHLIVYAAHDGSTLYWQWVKREAGQPDRSRQHIYHRNQPGEALIQKLEQLVFTLDEEEDTTIVDVSGRVRAAFDVEKVTKKFYERFKKEHHVFLGFLEGIKNIADREWYASLMLNRMMFIYFIQKRGFLNGDSDYLRNRLQRMQTSHGKDRFQTFYRLFLLRLFHEGLGQPEANRVPDLAALLGRVPYLNGGLFDVHDLERDNPEIHVPDKAFEQIFAFFDAYQWHLDDRPLHKDNEINPDVLGYIFEKYINQKQMGAYYTKEDITGYISRNTIIPFLFDRAKKECPIAFKPDGGVWRLLSDDPDRYFYEAVRHGITYDVHKNKDLAKVRKLPPEIAAGLNNVSKRGDWNKPSSPDYALPTETWREHVARRQRYEEIRAKLAGGELTSINDLITYNLDVEKFAQDVIAASEGPELVRAFWKALTQVSILDPTCGSGAFLFAALNILEPIYTTCLEAMRGFLDDLERSKRKHRPEKMKDFREALKQTASHASERYFIIKTIIVSNLYGVDIMEEAVEICKLRLFLKLVAQLESYKQIEPLPDVDFNVRAGNTLVGFTTRKQIQDAFVTTSDGQRRMLYAQDTAKLKRIEEDAEIADRTFRKFRAMQTQHGMDASEFAATKVKLRKRLDNLRDELDQYLAGEYAVKASDKKAYAKWRTSHQPFHWFVEFYGIMHDGGFDVIIGNPPYIEYKDVQNVYKIQNYRTEQCSNLFAFILERCTRLSRYASDIGIIVPLSAFSTDRMIPLITYLKACCGRLKVANFSWRPGKLFDGVNLQLSILLKRGETPLKTVESTRYLMWDSQARSELLSNIEYATVTDSRLAGSIPKLGPREAASILMKLRRHESELGGCLTQHSHNKVFYRRGGLYWKVFVDFETGSSEEKILSLLSEINKYGIIAALSSNLWWWYFTAISDCRHLGNRDIATFPFDPRKMSKVDLKVLCDLGIQYVKDLRRNAENQVRVYKGQKAVQCISFRVNKSKPIIDEIDRVLAKHYAFTDEELDFIINYDIKYRMGRDNPSSEEE